MLWVYIWLGVVVVSLVIEFVTFELVSVWISIGALLSMILALCGVGVEFQVACAVVVSLICLLALRKVTLKFLNRNKGKTNVDVAVGQIVHLITRTDDDQLGSAKFNGIVWSVKAEDNAIIEAGEYAKVVSVNGNKLIVKRVSKKEK